MGSTDFGLLFKDPLDHFIQVAGPDTFVRCLDYGAAAHVLWTGTNDSGVVKYTLPAVGFQESAPALDAGIFPNPGSELRIRSASDAEAELCDLSGRILLRKDLKAGFNCPDVDQLPAGIYVLLLRDKEGNALRLKWVKQ
jgi:hypothetical protein